MMTFKPFIVLVAGAALSLAACATVRGAGQDIQSVGEAGEDAIND